MPPPYTSTEFTVYHRPARYPITGGDSGIASLPASVYVGGVRNPGIPVLHVATLRTLLRTLGLVLAGNVGEDLHHSRWVYTTDVAVIEKRGIHTPGCVECTQGVSNAVEYVNGTGWPVLVGVLAWAGPLPEA